MKKLMLTLLIFSAAFAANVDMSLNVEEKVYHIGDRILLDYNIKAGEKYFFILPELKEYLGDVELLSVNTDKKIKHRKQIIKMQAEIVSFDTGFVHIPIMPLISTDSTGLGKPDTLFTPEKYIYVYSILDSSASPIAMNAPIPLALMTWWELLIVILLLTVTVGILVMGLKYRQKKNDELEIIWESPEEKAEHLLFELNSKHYPESEQWKDYYVELTYIIRDYFENIYYVHFQELTTSELVPTLSEYLNKEKIKSLEELFMFADLVKFAKGVATKEKCDHHQGIIKDIIREGKTLEEEQLD